ncbi:hypothetical protein MCOR29_011209 [Pyricularia oryzae]|uniref:Uncharacterized protein n=1 Tax=Pyricularia grisea TaxID=148305 RepID=A0ABQ8N591_PYRGI|nr:hypothetical protein MCOR33_010560 [Pyricularia grisea]KAI6296985.1 hypothetical protein MCOR29_011209 [Pyricularia oryzae]KAI6307346.1 hypothetical protein MCOR34_007627 [Pyricularia oryzae]KAI6340763.1 hypothetical protein MCOR28_006345 [Pyricularia oryzae]KAI6444475.1 hypothetical protein MCOR22_004795 [Pyricularia oryzae]
MLVKRVDCITLIAPMITSTTSVASCNPLKYSSAMMQFTYTLAIMAAYIAVSVAAQPPPEPPQMHAYIHGFPAQACQVSLYRYNENKAWPTKLMKYVDVSDGHDGVAEFTLPPSLTPSRVVVVVNDRCEPLNDYKKPNLWQLGIVSIRWDNEGRAPFDLKAVIAAANKERDEPNRAAMINLEKILAGQEPPAPSKGRTQAPTTLPDGRGLLRGLSKYFH